MRVVHSDYENTALLDRDAKYPDLKMLLFDSSDDIYRDMSEYIVGAGSA